MHSQRRTTGLLLLLFLSSLVLCLFVAVVILLAERSRLVMQAQLKQELTDIAAIGAMRFDGDVISRIHPGSTLDNSRELRGTVQALRHIRESVPGIRFAYIMRRTANPAIHEFVADADLGLSDAELDRNGNGVVDPEEQPSVPGMPYRWAASPKLGQEAFLHPTVDDSVSGDAWGVVISGYAPIRNAQGIAVAVLGIDKDASNYVSEANSVTSPVALTLILIAILSISSGALILFLKRRTEIAQQMENERTGLFRLTFHQLGSPLTILHWALEEMEEDGGGDPARNIANIRQAVQRFEEIMDTLKNADLVHNGKLMYQPTTTSLTAVLRRTVQNLTLRTAERQQTVTVDSAGDIRMEIDPALIEAVARELLLNAIDYSPVGATIVVRARETNRRAEFAIIDHGCGIPKKDLPRLFQEFARGSNATDAKTDGNGLGLYIVQGILEQAGGTIDVESKEGKGTTVTVRLPREK